MRTSRWLGALAAALFWSSALAQDVPPGGEVLVKSSDLIAMDSQSKGRFAKVPIVGQPFSEAHEVETVTVPANDWELQLGVFVPAAVKEGDVMLASFWARALKGQPESGEGRSSFDFATGAPEWEKSVSWGFGMGPEWRRYFVPFEVRRTRGAGDSIVAFRLGGGRQTVQIADFQLRRYASLKVGQLPRTQIRYVGDEPDAAWRKAAQARIEKIRMGDLELVVQDSAGRPLPAAAVKLRMTRHAFPWGTAVAADQVLAQGPEADKYREILSKYFNFVAIENHLKWPFWEEWGREDGFRALQWLHGQGYRIRAHNIIWPGWGNLPADLPKIANNRELLDRRIAARIAEITAATRGWVDEWDVANETYSNRDLIRIMGDDVVADWFRQAKKGDPRPTLTLNDYPPLDGAANQNAHLNAFYAEIERLVKAKAPIEAIGFQCHFGTSPVPPDRLLSGLDRFAKFGLPIVITELDLDSTDEDYQNRYLRDFLYAAFSHPSVASITQWGFWEGKHWLPNAALWRKDWSLKPHGQTFVDLVTKTWATNVDLRTDSSGRNRLRAYFGRYRAEVIGPDGRPRTFDLEVKPGSNRVVLKLPR